MGPSLDGFAYLPTIDTRGGILLAWDTTVLNIDNVVLDTHCLSGLVHTKDDQHLCVMVVYGPQGDEQKIEFLEELRTRRAACIGPWMNLGYFNMILCASEKSNNNINRRIMNKLRAFVDGMELKEVTCMAGTPLGRTSETRPP